MTVELSAELEDAAVELAAARRGLNLALLAAATFVEERAAAGDERTAGVARLVADAERRCAAARAEAVFALPDVDECLRDRVRSL